MKEVIAMHGWSGDSNAWSEWATYFENNGWDWKSGERGYGDLPPSQPLWNTESEAKQSQSRAVIAHSLGPHLITPGILKEATHIVLLCSFSSFFPRQQNNRALKQGIQGMRERLGTAKEITMLQNFLQKAYRPLPSNAVPPSPITKGLSLEGRERLKNDLELLINTSGLPDGIPTKAKVLVIDGLEDAIIPQGAKNVLIEDLTKHLQTPPNHWVIPECGHSLLVPGLIEKVEGWLD